MNRRKLLGGGIIGMVIAFLGGVILSPMIKPMLEKIPFVGGLFNLVGGGGSTETKA